jgi:glyoxylase-like metal-dependent hydrolase (beta-lactamase superfamily II)
MLRPLRATILLASVACLTSSAARAEDARVAIDCLDTRACSTYLLRTPQANTVIDAGGPLDPQRILRQAQALGARRIDNILVTHAHLDHDWGVQALVRRTGARVIVHEGDAPALRAGRSPIGVQLVTNSLRQRALVWVAERVPLPRVAADVLVRDGESLERFVGVPAHVVHVPGHTVGSSAFVVDGPAGRAIFAGDLVDNSKSRSWQQAFATQPSLMRASINRLLGEVTSDSTIYPGHGKPLTGAELRALPIPHYRAPQTVGAAD